MHPLVSTEWLAANLAERDLIVFDDTKYMPTEAQDGETEFLKAHIPGARFFDIDHFADPDTSLPHMVPAVGRMEKLAQAAGISNSSRIVFYDQKGLSSAARGWWLMGLFGHDRVAVLDGGLPKWRKEGRPTEGGAPPPPAAGTFRADFRARRLRGVGDVLAIVAGGGELVMDARAPGRFNATTPEPRAGIRGGHMPGAVNVPYTELLNADGTFRDAESLRARFAAAGADGTRPVVTSCGTGVTACILALGMVLAGLPQGAVYDGSWTEWGGRDDTPVTTA
ncbi:MAG: sulfurtransferase [Acetobacteraceae bacterium]|nr:sulfurtransferase [Acetobacteraceae bacterium]